MKKLRVDDQKKAFSFLLVSVDCKVKKVVKIFI